MNDPTPGIAKAGAAMIAGAVTVVLTYILNTYVLKNGGLPEQVDQAIQTLITVAFVYWAPHQITPKS